VWQFQCACCTILVSSQTLARKARAPADSFIPLRVSEQQEEIGLDLSQHGEVMHDAVTLAPESLLAKTA